ncbi:MAG: hypothetical protein AAF224_01135 [Pseudomonadota bacterium]
MGEQTDFFKSLRALITDFLEISPQTADGALKSGGRAPDANASGDAFDPSDDALKAALGRALVFQRRLLKEKAVLEREAGDDTQEKTDFAIRQGRDDLARAALADARARRSRIDDLDRLLGLASREIDALSALIDAERDPADENERRARTTLLAELDRLIAAASAPYTNLQKGD